MRVAGWRDRSILSRYGAAQPTNARAMRTAASRLATVSEP